MSKDKVTRRKFVTSLAAAGTVATLAGTPNTPAASPNREEFEKAFEEFKALAFAFLEQARSNENQIKELTKVLNWCYRDFSKNARKYTKPPLACPPGWVSCDGSCARPGQCRKAGQKFI